MNALETYNRKYMKKSLPEFEVGDTVDVINRIQEGDKTRKQTFTGTVIAFNGEGISRTFTVRRIVQGEGVERIFPLHSPKLVTVKVKRKGKTRRAKLFYLRSRVGKATKVKEIIWNREEARKSQELSQLAADEVDKKFEESKAEEKKS